MRRVLHQIFPLVFVGFLPAATHAANEDALRAEAKKVFKENVAPFVNSYCIKCHGDRPKAGINLKSALKDPTSASAFQHWEKAVANVKIYDMPPEEDAKIPSVEERQQFLKWMEKLKYLAPRDPGPFIMRRLTRVELGNTLRDLYGVAPSITDSLPEEVIGEGFLNSISPMQSELFLGVANQVLKQIFAPDNQSATAIQKRLFEGHPNPRQVARSLARDAYRRPPTEAELDVLIDVYNLGLSNELGHSAALGFMLKAILVSPQFLFITPAGKVESKDKVVLLDNHQLAARLSYLLWSTPPDPELAALADKGELQQTDVLRKQAERLLADDRSQALFNGFGKQWLRLGEFDQQAFDPKLFPQMTPELRSSMMHEARLLFRDIVSENKKVIQFVGSDHTYLNESLAKIYRLNTPEVKGPEMRRIKLKDPNRGGILGMPVTLATTSFPNRTSPVRRGVWVLEQILGERVPPPPPDVPELDDQSHENAERLTLRQRTELHQRDPVCANCHKVLDPIGFGLENFDAIGRWRDKNAEGLPIDSSGTFPNGKSFSSPAEMKALLIEREADLARNLTERFMAYALGRQLEGYDEVVIDQLMEKIAKDDYRVRTIIIEVVSSYLFTHRSV